MDKFQQRKKDILEKLDKSSVGGWDEKIKSLCDKINSKENYYTTSSCSGRIIVMIDQAKKGPGLFEFVSHDLVEDFEKFKGENLKFKSEPPILHVACKSIGDAEEILNKAREVGLKRSGIISLGKNIIVEIISTEKLEFPLVKEGKLLVSDEFLKIVLEKANDNLKKGWGKIDKLEKKI
jgi:tRNA wybutosine-synthesizing protein 3